MTEYARQVYLDTMTRLVAVPGRKFGRQAEMDRQVMAALALGKHVHVYRPDRPWCSEGCDLSKPNRGFTGRHVELDDPMFGALAGTLR